MTTIIHHGRRERPVAIRLASAALGAVGSSVSAVFRFIEAELDRRSTARLLGAEDAMLRDIGITRGDVYRALMTPRGEKPSRTLARQRREARAAEQAQAREVREAIAGGHGHHRH